MPSFYASDTNFINISYALDLAIEQHIADILLKSTLNRVIYSSNAYALRRRSKENNGKLVLPFVNYKLVGYNPGDRSRWNVRAYSKGVYVSELGIKVIYAPFRLEYEATYWCHRDDELRYAITQLDLDADNKTILKPTVTIGDQDVTFPSYKEYTSIVFDPDYDENDWLEKNKIHTATMDFAYETFVLQANADITIPTSVIFNWATGHDYDSTDYDEILEFVVDHLTETVTEE